MASTIITKNGTGSASPSSLQQGELAINVDSGKIFYGAKGGTAVSSSFTFDDLVVEGNLTAQQYIVSSSVTYMTQSFSSGSTIFGDSTDDTHTFTGSIDITGSITATEYIGLPSGLLSSSVDFVKSINSETPDAEGDVTLSTSDVPEHSSNLYYTDTRVKTKLNTETVVSGSASNVRTFLNVEDGADVTDSTNVQSAGALMDSELTEIDTVKELTKAGISGSFNAASASFSTRVTANDAKLTANTSNVQSAGALMDSEVTNLAQVKAFDSSDYATAAQGTKADSAIQPSQTSSFSTATGVENNADVTDTANVTAAGALMDSEVTNLAQVKAFDSSDYATAAQGTLADTAIQPADTGSFSTATGVEDNADVTDTANVTSAGALMDSEVTSLDLVKGLTADGISGSFNNASSSFSTRVTANDAKVSYTDSSSLASRLDTIETAGYTTNTGTVDTSGTPADNQVAVFTDADTIEGSNKLKFSTSVLEINSTNSDSAGIKVYGGAIFAATPYITPYGNHTTMYFGDGATGHVFDFRNNKISFDADSTNSYIMADTSTPENIEIHADGNIELRADDELQIFSHVDASSYNITASAFKGDGSALTNLPSQTDNNFTDADHTKLDGIEASADVTDTTNVKANLPSGMISGSTVIDNLILTGSSIPRKPDTTYSYQGELSPFAGSSLTAGDLVHYSGSGWAQVDASNDTATKHLGIAVTDKLVLIRGYVKNSAFAGLGTGNVIYASTTGGDITKTAPTGTGEYVRIVGYCVDSGTRVIYFNPSTDWLELA